MRLRKSIFQGVDWFIVLMYLALVILGWLNIYAANYDDEKEGVISFSRENGKQLIFIGTALFLALVILILDPNFFSAFAYGIYGIVLILLVAVYFGGTEIKGSKSWFRFGEFGFQPAEFAKFATALALEKYLSGMNIRLQRLKTKIISLIIILVPFLVILKQNETGTALVYSAFAFVLYREGLSGNILLIGFFIALLAIFALLFDEWILVGILGGVALMIFLFMKKRWGNFLKILAGFLVCSGIVFGVDFAFNKLHDYQKKRVNVWLGKERDSKSKKDEYYNVHQSLVAIGSGGATGKGFLQGTQTKFKYVPEQSTDFIFCTIGEEWGFLGSATFLLIYLGLILRIFWVAEKQRSIFSRIFGYGVASILFMHLTVNVGMTLGLAPVIGIPLPFISYGGSSLWGFTIMLFIFVKLDSHRLEIFR